MRLTELFEGVLPPFVRSPEYTRTYEEKILPNSGRRKAFRAFMELKRNNPNERYGSSDKPFASKGIFNRMIPDLKHAHVSHDLSIVYAQRGGQVYLYGFYTHDELGTGQPKKPPVQKSMALRFLNMFG